MNDNVIIASERRFSGYTITQFLGEAGDFALHRALRHDDQARVLLKVPVGRQPSQATLRRLEHEYQVASELDPLLTLGPVTLESQAGSIALVLEDSVCQSLADIVGTPMEVGRFLKLGVGAATAVAELHRCEFVHKDIKPTNMFLDPDGHVRLSGLGLASRLRQEHQRPEPPTLIAGTLAYMAPEQTGRMNRSIDSRSDLYALGVMFYEMLTGELPFTAADPMEWVHCHIARQAVAPMERNAAIPELLSAIVMKLLAKTAEERYQTALGLAADLKRCLAEWDATGGVALFPLGMHDIPDRLLIPEKLYGREGEINALVGAFNRVVAQGFTELMLVSGYSGIGKSSVVNELHKVLVPPRGLFASGKFDQYKRDIPYATLAQALQTLVRHLLSRSEAEVERWREALREAVGSNGQLMVDLIPEVELIVGPQPPAPELPPHEARNRFQAVLRRFLGVFTRPEHPLVLFLDDLQWLDAATLELLKDLTLNPDVQYLFLIGAYRDNEVSPTHPLLQALEAIRQGGARVHEIVLGPLTREDVEQLLADSLRCKLESAAPLARLLYEKTGGNPFFAIQFLTALAEERLLSFDPSAGRWTWDLGRIRAKRFTDNVVKLMVSKLMRLPGRTQEVLKHFACLGNVAGVATLNRVHEGTEETLHADIWESVRAGLVFREEETYTFLHDRVQEAAYSLIPADERAGMHLRIGRLLASGLSCEAVADRIFDVVSQLNRGSELVESPEERERIAELNLLAGQHAKTSTAYTSALAYLSAAAALLTEDCWEHRHELMFQLELNRAECEFLTGALVEAEKRLAALSTRAVTTVEQATVTGLRVDLYTTLDQSDRAIAVGLDYLRELGIDWSLHPTEEEARHEYEGICSQIGSRKIEDLIDLPLMTDPTSLATLDVLSKMAAPAMFMNENMSSLIACKAVSFSIEHGAGHGSCPAYEWLAIVAGPRLGDYQACYRFGRLGYELVAKRGLKRFEAMTYMLFGCVVIPWTRHIKTGRPILRQAFEMANRSGDLTYAAYSCDQLDTNFLAAGDPLSEVQREVEHGLAFAQKARFGLVIDTITPHLAFVRTLRGLTPRLGVFDDGEFDEHLIEHRFASDPNLAMAECTYWVRKLQARFLAGDYETAIAAASMASRLLWTVTAVFELGEYHFYSALSHAASCAAIGANQYTPHLEALAAHHGQLQTWAANCPENFETRAALVGAEIARLEGRDLEAMRLYERAIGSARENGFIQNEALAFERASAFYRERGFDVIADAYLREARYRYARWGADGKVRQLDEQHPWLLEKRPLELATIAAPAEQLDTMSVAKALHAISGEIIMDRLSETLLRIVLENAGAQKGYLFVEPDSQLLAIVRSEQGKGTVEFSRTPSMSASNAPASILSYVKRTRQTVILENAGVDAGEFSTDEYLLRAKPKSVLCMPIVRQAKLIGILYLENNLITGAFTKERRAILEMLASQAAISLETAKLYADLQRSQDDLHRQTLILRSILDSIGEGVVVANEQGEFLVYNPAAEAILGTGMIQGGPERWTPHFGLYLPDQVTPHPPEDLPLARAIRGGSVDAAELYMRPAGRPEGVWLSVTARPLTGQTGLVSGGVAVFSDITARKRAEAEIRSLNSELEQRVIDRTRKLEAANKELTSFSYSVSHDLRAPLRSIDGFSRILQEDYADRLDEEGRENLGKIRASSQRMSQLIDDMLQLSRVALTELRRAPVDLSALARVVCEELRRSEPQRSAEFVIEPGLIDQADRHLMRIVFDNLLGNAWKFTGRQPAPKIEFGRSERDGAPAYFVRDNGAGFDEQFAHKLFQPFQRLHSASEFPGTGIGLATVQRVIHRHGGRVWAEAERGRGATIFFTLRDRLEVT